VDEYLSQGSLVVDSSDKASSEDSSIESEYDDSNKDNNAGSIDNDSIAPNQYEAGDKALSSLKLA
jgi:hypothetical protein